MTTDNETLLGRLISGASHLLQRRTVHTLIQCADCGEYKKQGEKTRCGSHLKLSEMREGDELVYISLKPPTERLPEPKVERLGPSDEPQKSFRHEDTTKAEPIAKTPATPEETEVDEWAGVRNTGGYSRTSKGLDWDSSTKDFEAAIDRAQNKTRGDDDDDHDPTPTLPIYVG